MINTCIELIGRTCSINTERKHSCRIVVSKPERNEYGEKTFMQDCYVETLKKETLWKTLTEREGQY